METLVLKDINIQFENKIIYDNFNYQFEEGKIYLLMGSSGRGKTTLAKIICGHTRPTSGLVQLGNNLITAPNSSIFLVNQQDDLFPWLTVREQLSLFGMKDQDINIYLKICKLEDHDSQYPHQLSGGMKKRLALLRAQALDSKVIILDETFSFIDQELSIDILKKLF